MTEHDVKTPTWDRARLGEENRSVCTIGPWTATCVPEVDEDGDLFWVVKSIDGPYSKEHAEYWDDEYHSTQEDAEYEAIRRISCIADLLEPLQRYL